MNNNCHIVRDLLPSYIDNICSNESREFIEGHVHSCNECRKILDSMTIDIHLPYEINKIERLEAKKPFKKVSVFFKVQKKLTNYLLLFSIITLVFGVYFLVLSILEIKEFEAEVSKLEVVEVEKEVIMNEVFNIFGTSNEVTEQEEQQMIEVFKKYQEKLNLLAIFPAPDLKNWIKENELVTNEPTTIYPIDYQKAVIVIGNEGIIGRKEQINPSHYDLGNVVMANNNWVIQYEYKSTYEDTIERHHQLKHYAPSIWSFYQLPILFLTLFSVVFVVWLLLKKHNKQLKDVIG